MRSLRINQICRRGLYLSYVDGMLLAIFIINRLTFVLIILIFRMRSVSKHTPYSATRLERKNSFIPIVMVSHIAVVINCLSLKSFVHDAIKKKVC